MTLLVPALGLWPEFHISFIPRGCLRGAQCNKFAQYQVQTPKILTNVVPEIPLWTYPPIRICPFLETKKQGLLNEEMRAIFLAHQERHPTVHIYTDGSKSTEGVGFAAVFPNTTSGGRLTREASIFTAELYAINVVHEILKGTIDGNRFTVFSD